LRTINGGTNWVSQISGPTNNLFAVSFTDTINGTAVGENGKILRTTNGGTNWITQSSGTFDDLLGVSFTDDDSGTIVGENGRILRTNNGGVTSAEDENDLTAPNEFFLSQNFPNPFNPSTIINFSVPKQSNVTLIIYDVIGNEVTALVDEEKSIGNYSVEFSALNHSSGIYYYQMRTDGFIQTKKMILLK